MATISTATPAITIERRARRSYILGNTYSHRDALRAAGAHWDPEVRAWWIGSQAVAESLVAGLVQTTAAPAERPAETLADDAREIIGRGTYRGHSYYVIGRVAQRGRTAYDRDEIAPVKTRDGEKVKLAYRDGSRMLWAPVAEVTVERRYERLTSIRSLREYAAQAKANGGYVPRFGVDYCGGICPVGGHRCTADHPCHDCQ